MIILLPALLNNVALVPNFGQRLLKTVELEIGGQRIDKHYSEWLYIWNELSLPMLANVLVIILWLARTIANLCTKLAGEARLRIICSS